MKSPQGNPNDHPITEFDKELKGTCLCGSISVTIRDPELFTRPRGHLCHCANCRKTSGSCVASNLIIESDKVDIQDSAGTLRTYDDYDTLSGNPVHRSFCSVDGKWDYAFILTVIHLHSPTHLVLLHDILMKDQLKFTIVANQVNFVN